MAGPDKTLEAIFAEPTRANIRWSAVETMLRKLGAEIQEGAGSRVRVTLRGRRAVFHRPHPQPQTRRSLIRAVRQFLESAGVKP